MCAVKWKQLEKHQLKCVLLELLSHDASSHPMTKRNVKEMKKKNQIDRRKIHLYFKLVARSRTKGDNQENNIKRKHIEFNNLKQLFFFR